MLANTLVASQNTNRVLISSLVSISALNLNNNNLRNFNQYMTKVKTGLENMKL